MIKTKRFVLEKYLLLMISLLFFGTAHAEKPLGHNLSAISKPRAAANFTLEDMDEEQVRFSDYKGKVVLLNFWATWCPPCKKEMPSMERLHQGLAGESFAVVAINQMEDADHVFAYTGELDVEPTFTILFDKSSSVSSSYKVQGLPTTYLIDKKGNIRYRAIGGREFDHPKVEALIRRLMKE